RHRTGARTDAGSDLLACRVRCGRSPDSPPRYRPSWVQILRLLPLIAFLSGSAVCWLALGPLASIPRVRVPHSGVPLTGLRARLNSRDALSYRHRQSVGVQWEMGQLDAEQPTELDTQVFPAALIQRRSHLPKHRLFLGRRP